MGKYKIELEELRTHDRVQYEEEREGYTFLATCGHGYLVVPIGDKNASIAKKICEYGYKGRLAYYLEEDCEVGEFLKQIK